MTVAEGKNGGVDATVLLVEDDASVREVTQVGLQRAGFTVLTARDGNEGLDLFRSRRPDAVVLDVMLPGKDGLEVCRAIRRDSAVPVVMLTALSGTIDVVVGLEAGADDYVTKPFGMNELLARLRAALRRASPAEEGLPPMVETPDFVLDLAAKRVHRAGEELRLTPTEWHLVEVLVRHPGKLVGQRQLLKEVWGPQYETETNYLRVFMAQIRRKLEPDPAHPRYFITEPGMGYRFEPPEVS